MSYLGDFYLGSNIDHKFTTVNTSGVPTILTGSPAVVVYPDNSTTEITSGITLTASFDGRTGLNHVRVAATSGNGYATGTNYSMVLSTGTVGSGGTYIGGYMIGEFSIEARAALRPNSDGRDIALSPAGFVDVNDKTGFSLSSPQTFNLIGNITGTFVGNLYGNVTGSVQSVQTPVGISTGTFLDAVADKVWDEQLGAHLVTGSAGKRLNDAASAGSDPWSTNLPGAYSAGQAGHIVGTNLDTLISSRMSSGTVVVGANNDKTGYSLSSPQNFNWIGNLSGTWVGLHQGDTIGNTTGTWMGNISGTLGVVNGLTPSRLDVNVSSRMATGTLVNANLKQIDEQTTNGNNATLNLKRLSIVNNHAFQAPVDIQATGVGNDAIDISSDNAEGLHLTGIAYGAFIRGETGISVNGTSGSGVEATGIDKSIFAPQGIVGDIIGNITGTLTGNVLGTSGIRTGTFIEAIADQVWDEQISGHLITGSTGKKLNDAGSAGDPWSTNLPAAYSAGQAGYILGTNLDTKVSSRMPSGTVVALVTGTVNANVTQWLSTAVQTLSGDGFVKADLKSIEDELTSGNNATLKLKKLSIWNTGVGDNSLEIFASGPGGIATNIIGDDGLAVSINSNSGLAVSVFGETTGMQIGGVVASLRLDEFVRVVSTADAALQIDGPAGIEVVGNSGDAISLSSTGGKSINAPNGIIGNIVGNITGTLVGNIYGNVTGSVGSVFGLNPALLDVAVSSRLASGTFAANYVTPPTASQNATEVLNQASANPIDANVQQVNDVNLQGDGSTTPWGPA